MPILAYMGFLDRKMQAKVKNMTKINWDAAQEYVAEQFPMAKEAMQDFAFLHWRYEIVEQNYPPHIEIICKREAVDLRFRETISHFETWQANPPEDEMAEVAHFVARVAEKCGLRAFRDWRTQPGKLVYLLKPDYKRDFRNNEGDFKRKKKDAT